MVPVDFEGKNNPIPGQFFPDFGFQIHQISNQNLLERSDIWNGVTLRRSFKSLRSV